MLADFQQALADLTASPELCNAVRADAGVLSLRYSLTERELRRLLGIAHHPGMVCNCTVYRMNRLAPIAMNLRGTLRALGPALRPLISDYWRDCPHGHAHFFIEANRFSCWLRLRIEAGEIVPSDVWSILERESAAVREALEASRT
jgi:hypothetical protein